MVFRKTYEEIESASTYYWNYQRYQMIADYVRRSPLVPPIIIFWHFYEAYQALGDRCASIRNSEQIENNPFCKAKLAAFRSLFTIYLLFLLRRFSFNVYRL